MVDFSLFDKALKTTWVRRLCYEDSGPWKFIPLSLLSNVGGKLLFQCNYDVQSSYINEHLPKILPKHNIILARTKQHNSGKKKEDILNQTIWNNRLYK